MLATGLALALLMSVGAGAQALNIGFGLWFTEIFIFYALTVGVLRWSGRQPARFVGLSIPRASQAIYGLALGAANFFALVVPLQFFSQSIAPEWMRELVDSTQLFRDQSSFDLVVIVSGVGLAAPFCEELFFRGLLQQGLAPRLGVRMSLIATAFIFSAFHIDPIGLLARFELGVLFGLLMLQSRSVWPGIFAHAANNLVSTAIYFASKDVADPNVQPELLAVAGLSAGGAFALYVLLMIGRSNPSLWSYPPAEELLDRRGPVSAIRLILPWALGAILSAGAVVAVDPRGVQLNYVDLKHRLPKPKADAPADEKALREDLRELRKAAREGLAPIDDYRRLRQQASKQLKQTGKSAP